MNIKGTVKKILGKILYNLYYSLSDKEFIREVLQEFINQSKPGSILSCCINYMDMLAPVEMLKMYPHCLYPSAKYQLNYFIEDKCYEWLSSQIKPGDIILDIGAAFGVISLPLSRILGKKGHIYAFEPAKKTQQFLQEIIDLNQVENITVIKSAISDEPSYANFIEYSSNNNFSWASDISTLEVPSIKPSLKHTNYQVEVTTIDHFVHESGLNPKAIKIDIEGFELYALYGGKSTLEKYRPYLSIDIHIDVKTGVSSLEAVKNFLQSLGYNLEYKSYTLYCKPH